MDSLISFFDSLPLWGQIAVGILIGALALAILKRIFKLVILILIIVAALALVFGFLY